ncbi:SLAC1 anion channel family protein [Prodigiosinella aquatilis]|nr:SLAC1 anion channel family protein [Prodigiosinella sp. LS101]WJV52439.1 SLAC1 anion channel family protein [Prodigiosinella sp. LS101]WJV56793.1 SLAC1 anion channel family protein [Pectobacteriaceae bacterium C111]
MNPNETLTKSGSDVSRITLFPISFFSVVMGLSGFTLAWKGADSLFFHNSVIWLILAYVTSVGMVVISIIYAIKAWRYPEAVLEEIRHPVRINFFPAFSISLLLLSVVWQQETMVATYLWMIGVALQITLTLYVMSSWIHHTHYTLSHANPSWFIPVVGNIIIPITGSQLGYTELSWFCFSIGIIFWIVLLTIIMYRLFFHEPLPARMTPMLFILLAPPSVGFISYISLVGELDVFARVIYYIALFLGLLLAMNISRFIKVPFFISSWAYSFPLAALTIASMRMAHLTSHLFFQAISAVLLCLLTILLTWLAVRTVKAVFAAELCQPE